MTDQKLHKDPDWDGYNKYMDALEERELSNIEAYDKAILTVSSAGLALSIAMLDFFSAGSELLFVSFVVSAWVLFIVSIISTIGSFLIANLSINGSRGIAVKHYIDVVPDSHLERNKWDAWLITTTWVSGAAFSLALICVVTFAIANTNNKQLEGSMKTDKNTTSTMVLDGAGAPVMRISEGTSNQPKTHVVSGSGIAIPYGAGAPQVRPTPASSGSTSAKGNKG